MVDVSGRKRRELLHCPICGLVLKIRWNVEGHVEVYDTTNPAAGTWLAHVDCVQDQVETRYKEA